MRRRKKHQQPHWKQRSRKRQLHQEVTRTRRRLPVTSPLRRHPLSSSASTFTAPVAPIRSRDASSDAKVTNIFVFLLITFRFPFCASKQIAITIKETFFIGNHCYRNNFYRRPSFWIRLRKSIFKSIDGLSNVKRWLRPPIAYIRIQFTQAVELPTSSKKSHVQWHDTSKFQITSHHSHSQSLSFHSLHTPPPLAFSPSTHFISPSPSFSQHYLHLPSSLPYLHMQTKKNHGESRPHLCHHRELVQRAPCVDQNRGTTSHPSMHVRWPLRAQTSSICAGTESRPQ